MKLKRLVLPMCAAAALALFAAASSEAQSAPKGGPKATFIKGDVEAGDGKTFARVKRGQEIAPGSVVKTGDGARAELSFPDGSIVRVGPNAELNIGAAAYDGKTKEVKVEANLVAGQAWAKVSKLVGDDAKFEVKTSNAVAGVRGTVFRVNVDRDEATVVKVYNGQVAVAAPLLASQEQNVGDTGPISSDRKPIPPPFQEVTKKEFEHLLGKMMQVRIAKGQSVSEAKPVSFTQQDDQKEEAEWVRWNSARDAGKDTEKSD